MQSTPLPLGLLIHNRFRVLSLLGAGGQGAVYRAADSRCHDREVALKVIQLTSEQSDALKRATAEFAVFSQLSHQNIVRVFDAGRLPDNGCFIAMEYIAGVPMAARVVAAARIPVPVALKILRYVAIGPEGGASRRGHSPVRPGELRGDHRNFSSDGVVGCPAPPVGAFCSTPHFAFHRVEWGAAFAWLESSHYSFRCDPSVASTQRFRLPALDQRSGRFGRTRPVGYRMKHQSSCEQSCSCHPNSCFHREGQCDACQESAPGPKR